MVTVLSWLQCCHGYSVVMVTVLSWLQCCHGYNPMLHYCYSLMKHIFSKMNATCIEADGLSDLYHLYIADNWNVMQWWSILVVLVCVPGNILILVGSLKYRAIDLNQISVCFIRNIAVADIGTVLFYVIPRLYGLRTGRSGLEGSAVGDVFCGMIALTAHLFVGASNSFTAALNISKLYMLLHSGHPRSRRTRAGWRAAGALWSSAVFIPILLISASYIGSGEMVKTAYIPSVYRCGVVLITAIPLVEIAFRIITILFGIVPCVIVIVTTLWLIVFLRSIGAADQRAPIVTVVMISLSFLVAFLPSCLYPLVIHMLRTKMTPPHEGCMTSDDARYHYYLSAFNKVSISAMFLSLLANPLVYLVTVRSFRRFLLRTVYSCWIAVQTCILLPTTMTCKLKFEIRRPAQTIAESVVIRNPINFLTGTSSSSRNKNSKIHVDSTQLVMASRMMKTPTSTRETLNLKRRGTF